MAAIEIIKFGAPRCAPCRTMDPVFYEVSEEYPWVTFTSVNTDDDPDDLATRWQITGIPTVLVLADGSESSRLPSAMPAAGFKRWLREAIAEAAS